MSFYKLILSSLCVITWHHQLLLQWRQRRQKNRRKRRWWIRPINKSKEEQGYRANLLRELETQDHEEFFKNFRMWPEHFNWLLDRVREKLQKQSRRTPLDPKLRLQVTLLYLAQGDSILSKHTEFRIGKSTVHAIIPETCQASWEALQPIFLPVLDDNLWKRVADGFMDKWQFPNCLGAIDGKHVCIKAPPMSRSEFYNYKRFFSIVLLGACDAEYKFTWVDIGQYDKYTSQFGTGSQYAYYHDEDETTFHLVDTTRVQKPPYQRGRFRHNQRNLRGRGGQRGALSQMQQLGKLKLRERERKGQAKRWGRQQGLRNHKNQPPIKIRDASVTVRPDWTTIEEMDFPRLAKLSLPGVKDGEDILYCGSLEYYDKTYDRVSVKNEKTLQRIDRIFHTVTTTDDPIIRKLSKTEGNVYATDAILATIMCCTRSNYSWDIVIEKIGDKLFFDKRDNTEFDLLTVNETSVEPPQDDGNSLNSPRNLALEATFINHNFSHQVLKSNEPRYKFEEGNPFIAEEEESDVASVAYRYRKWDLNNGIVLVARCEHDAVIQGPNNEIQFLTIKALNEWDSKLANGVEWRQKLDTQRGAVLANELRNNACKLAKWTVQALLAGSDQLKFGYVLRAIVRDSSKHVILGTQQYKPNEFATQINLNMDNAWGILRCIIDICMKQKDGKYLIMKDPNKPMIRLYDIPDNTFESEGEEDEDDDKPVNDAFQS